MTVPDAPLPMIEAALLWSMRAWVIGHCRGVDVAGRIGTMFTQLEAPRAADYLDGFMQTLCRSATRTLEVNCVCYPTLSADEAALLDVHALQQLGYEDEAYAVLRRMLTHAGAVTGCDRSARLTLLLTAAGHSLPRTADAVRRHAFVQYATSGAAAVSTHLH